MLQAILILFHGSDWKLIQCKLDVSGWMSYRNKSFKMCIHCWCYIHKDTYARNHEPIKNNIHVIIRMVMVFRFQCPGSGGRTIRQWTFGVGCLIHPLAKWPANWKLAWLFDSPAMEWSQACASKWKNLVSRDLTTFCIVHWPRCTKYPTNQYWLAWLAGKNQLSHQMYENKRENLRVILVVRFCCGVLFLCISEWPFTACCCDWFSLHLTLFASSFKY